MKEENKIQIRVQSKTEQRMMEDFDVAMITEWDVKKIVMTVCYLLLLVSSLIYYFFATQDAPEEINKQVEVQKLGEINSLSVKKVAAPAEKKRLIKHKDSVDRQKKDRLKNSVKKLKTNLVKSPPTLIKNRQYIRRGLLVKRTVNKEPSGVVKLPLVVNKEKAMSLTYFTEIIDMKGSSIYHEWLINNKVVYKKKINIYGSRWRISTRKLFSYTATGRWKVRAVTNKGDILHQIDFLVTK